MRRLLTLVFVALALFIPATASAFFHQIRIVEVCGGKTGVPKAQYVQLQMYSGSQTSLSGHSLTVYSNQGNLIGSVPLTSVSNGSSQATILIGTDEVAAAFGVTPDMTLTTALPNAGGTVCFDVYDCFSWGTAGADAGVGDGAGQPFNPSGGLPLDQAAKRKLGPDGILQDTDDTNNSANDFELGTPNPKPNAPPPSDAGADSGPKDSGTPTDSGTPADSGASTTRVDSGSNPPTNGGDGDDGGCTTSTVAPHGSAIALFLASIAFIGALSRRRRSRA